ncbi:hypothetical protein [Pseudoalteromonas sp. 68 DY56-GL68]|uniref:hypothetical protein n=1 Tax=Pseudoalteromonas sp. 68 DY56-GL68 TaxID=2974919 RepID=UPI00352B2B88
MPEQVYSGKNADSKRMRTENASSRSRVRLYARGNVNIQADRFVTQEEKDERKKSILSFSFA